MRLLLHFWIPEQGTARATIRHAGSPAAICASWSHVLAMDEGMRENCTFPRRRGWQRYRPRYEVFLNTFSTAKQSKNNPLMIASGA